MLAMMPRDGIAMKPQHHLADDPMETRNLSQDPAAAPDMETMRRKLDRQRIELGPHRAWERPSEK